MCVGTTTVACTSSCVVLACSPAFLSSFVSFLREMRGWRNVYSECLTWIYQLLSSSTALQGMVRRPFAELPQFRGPHGESPDANAMDLLEKLLQYDPEVRLTAQQALEHPFFENYHEPMDEPSAVRMMHVLSLVVWYCSASEIISLVLMGCHECWWLSLVMGGLTYE